MKVTQAMIDTYMKAEVRPGTGRAGGVADRLQAVLDLIMPDIEQAQRVYVDGDTVTVIDRRERPRLAYGLTRGMEYRIDVDARPIPAEPAE